MEMIFGKAQADEISKTLGQEYSEFEGGYVWKLKNDKTKQQVVLTVYSSAGISTDKNAPLISVQTTHGYFELHSPDTFMTIEPDEVIFLKNEGDKLSSMTVGGSATCSMFSNISRSIIETDFSELDPAVLLSAMQLSLTDASLVG